MGRVWHPHPMPYNTAMEHVGYLIVPRNRAGMVGQMAGDADADDLLFFPFTRSEQTAIQPLMKAFEDSFSFDSAGRTAEQLIDTRYAALAADIARDFARGAQDDSTRTAALRVAEALDAALDYGSYTEFAFD